MMAKRKRSTTTATGSRKKSKVPHAHGSVDPDHFYRLKSIVGESGNKYLISWEDDEVTGEKFEDTWEPKGNANRQAVLDWEKQKAEKKRLEELSGAVNNSPSTSVSSTPQPSTLPRPKIRISRRRVIESSPQPGSEPVTNGHPAESSGQEDNPIEIGESDEEAEEIGSPLFHPQLPIVQPSPPPSSYLAGGYQAISPTQATSSPGLSQTQAKKSPEPSQYFPDPADTSKTTEDTTEISLAPTTPSVQLHQTQTDLPQSSIGVVPDSQAVAASASYIPSAADTVPSSSASDHQQADDSIEDISSASAREQAGQPLSSAVPPLEALQIVSGAELPQSGNPSGSDVPVSAEGSREVEAVESSGIVQGAAPAKPLDTTETAEIRESPAAAEITQAAENANQGVETAEVTAHSTDSFTPVLQHDESSSASNGVLSRQSPSISAAARVEQVAQESLSESNHIPSRTPEQRLIPQNLSGQNERHATASNVLAASPTLPENTNRPIVGETSSPIDSSRDLNRHSDPPLRASANEGQSALGQPSQLSEVRSQQPANYIDLTQTQNHANSIQSFPVTSPVTRPIPGFGIAGRRTSPRPLSSSTWQSPFPFQTQPAHPTASQAFSINFSPQSIAQSQPLPQSHSHPPSQGISNFLQSQPSPLLVSSSIIPAPSQSIEPGTFGESAPPPPPLLSSPYRSPSITRTMDPSDYKTELGETLSARLAAMRDRNRAKFSGTSQSTTSSHQQEAASQNVSPAQLSVPPKLASPFLLANDRARSPSAVPAMEPLTAITRDEMNTSRRVITLLPQSHEGHSDETNDALTNSASQTQMTPHHDPELANVHALPVYFLGHQRDQYPQMVHFREEMIQRFLAAKSPDTELITEAQRFLDRIRHITIHPDLDDVETFTQYDIQPSQQVKWHSSFAKFHFLRGLLDRSRETKLHIAIVAGESRTLDILETFFEGLEVPHRRYSDQGTQSSSDSDEGRNGLRVSLLQCGSANTHSHAEPANLVIAMDNSVEHQKINGLRKVADTWSPLVTLVVPYTVEHIERCISPTLPDRARLRALVSGVYKYRLQAGRPSPGEQSSRDTVQVLADYLTNPENGTEWPLPGLANLEDLDSQTESEVTVNDTSKLAIGEKRSRESDELDDNETHKRSRVESPVGAVQDASQIVNLPEIDITHVSDSVEKATQDAVIDSSELSSTEKRLQVLNQETQNRLEEHVRDLNDLQYRFEEMRTKLIQVTTERDAAIDTAQNAITRYSAETNQTSNLRNELSFLKEQLEEANKKLIDHSVPERADFEALRLDLVQAKADKEKTERRLEQANKDAAYVRDLYQNDSSRVQTLAAQVSDLENQLAVAENRATGEQAKLRQMSNDNFTKNLQTENKKLKALLKEREAGLKFRDEEIAKLKEASRGRMGTRGTSVPRSPRIGSRQTSPATGELRGRTGLLHPLRNAEM